MSSHFCVFSASVVVRLSYFLPLNLSVQATVAIDNVNMYTKSIVSYYGTEVRNCRASIIMGGV